MSTRCVRCVMDTDVSDIVFDQEGICSYCKQHEFKMSLTPFSTGKGEVHLNQLLDKITSIRSGQYDCIVGLSGGVDSSYVAYEAVTRGLRPLAVHFDNGWNSQKAVKNVENIVKKLNLDLITYVIDWPEFRDIQRSFFKANVVDIEMITDHAIFAAMYQIAKKHNIRYILSGTNVATEAIMPRQWQHFKFDLKNLKAIHGKFGNIPIKNFPTLNIWKIGFNHYFSGIKTVSILNYIPYRKDKAMDVLCKELNWEYYGGKHYESIFTRFYQAHILPIKFGIDKRKIHYSDLIMNEEISREQALEILSEPLYKEAELKIDREFVLKKLGITDAEFKDYMLAPPVSHFEYPSAAKFIHRLINLHKNLESKKTHR